jgi:hypothetical protein
MGLFSGPGLTPSLKGWATNEISLQAGQVMLVYPAGWYALKGGLYTAVQQYDPISTTWRTIGGGGADGSVFYFYSDGENYRLANQTGCVVGGVITTNGTGYVSAPTITTTTGAIIKVLVGGAISQTVTVSNAGTGYTYPPQVIFSAPPSPGVQATGYCTLTTGTVTSVTVVDQGAGYTSPPTVTFQNDPRELTPASSSITTGYGAAAVATLTGSQVPSAILVLDHGNPVTVTAGSATSIPTLTIAGGGGGASFAATAIMCWSITGLISSGYQAGAVTSGTPVAWLTGEDIPTAAATTILNPTFQANLVRRRQANIKVAISTGSYPSTYNTTNGFLIQDGGIYTGTPLAVFNQSPAATVTTGPLTGFAMGGVTDVCYLTQV